MALITVATEEGDSFPVDVSLDISLEDLCALLEADVSPSRVLRTHAWAELTLLVTRCRATSLHRSSSSSSTGASSRSPRTRSRSVPTRLASSNSCLVELSSRC